MNRIIQHTSLHEVDEMEIYACNKFIFVQCIVPHLPHIIVPKT